MIYLPSQLKQTLLPTSKCLKINILLLNYTKTLKKVLVLSYLKKKLKLKLKLLKKNIKQIKQIKIKERQITRRDNTCTVCIFKEEDSC